MTKNSANLPKKRNRLRTTQKTSKNFLKKKTETHKRTKEKSNIKLPKLFVNTVTR